MTKMPALAGAVDGVVIGTSAGGVEALSIVLPALPETLRASVFVVQHLPRERPSLLVDILAPKCRVPVKEADDKEPVRPGVVYVAPPDYHLLLDRGPRLALSADEVVHFSRPSVDVLFESAAEVYGPRLLGILLTGASEDGADGLAAIKRAGGWTAVQDVSTTVAAQMVEAALKRGPVDFVGSLEQIARLLTGLSS